MPKENPVSQITRIKIVREAGKVKRCHAMPHHGHYDIAQHSFGAVNLLMILHPNPSADLIKAVLWHDVAERWLGDVPSPGKGYDQNFKSAYEKTERRVLKKSGLWTTLNPEELNWLQAVDSMEFWLWCLENELMGNRYAVARRMESERHLSEMLFDGVLPSPVARVFEEISESPDLQLSDFFHLVVGE